ncbi:unnamed protein product [Lymnaea stagnalis]|uniref:Uncharacterized protein n=1 Tax=Lymnaea stagnalis TaxID=6523 RepID=A0AAV2HGA9_LYMST
MTCQSFNLFTCSASQNGNNSTKNMTVYAMCPPQLTKESKATLVVDAELYKQISIALEIYGYPEPKKYTIVKNGALVTHFYFVVHGSTSSYLYNIAYTLTISPYGLVNLSFVILDHSDFTTYILIVDNNGSQALNYTFLVQEAVTVSSFHIWKLILLLAIICASAFLGVAIVCRVKQYKRKNPVLYDKPMSRKIHDLEERSTQDDTHTGYLKVIDRTSDEGQEYPDNANIQQETRHYELIDNVI